METTEFIHHLGRQLLEKLDEARSLVERIEDQPIRQPGKPSSVYREMLAVGQEPDHAWTECTEIIGLRNQIKRMVGDTRAETEVLVSIASDVIGKTGRLV